MGYCRRRIDRAEAGGQVGGLTDAFSICATRHHGASSPTNHYTLKRLPVCSHTPVLHETGRHELHPVWRPGKTIQKLGVAPKAQLLNLAVRAGLPVPNGIVILDGVWARLQEWIVMAVDGEDVHVTNGAFLLEVMALHQLKRSVVVRRAFRNRIRRPATFWTACGSR